MTIPPPERRRPRPDFLLRRMILVYLVAMTVAQWAVTAVELAHPVDASVRQGILFCSVYFPWAVMPVGLAWIWSDWRANGRRYEQAAQPDWRWLLLTLEAFLFITSGYFLVQRLAAGLEMHDLSIPLDDRIPFVPATAWGYITNAWAFLIPLVALRDEVRIERLRPAYMSVSVLCWICFLVYPVGIDRPVPDLATMSGRGVALLYSIDVGNNCFPSLHCAQALFAALLLRELGRAPGWFGFVSAMGIALTTLTTKQHYVVDVFAGFAVAIGCYALFRPGRQPLPEGRSCALSA